MKDFRFLHAADIHLDSPLKGLAQLESNENRMRQPHSPVVIKTALNHAQISNMATRQVARFRPETSVRLGSPK
jgi:hypothetical protein